MNKEPMITYLDYNAGAPIRPEALEVVVESLSEVGNASSIHQYGRKARRTVEEARIAVAELVSANPQNVIFTSGGTEANVMALSPTWYREGNPFEVSRLFVSSVEHPSVLSGGRFPVEKTSQLPVSKDGVVDLDELRGILQEVPDGETALVSVMAANSETGVLQPLQQISVIVEDAGHLLHVDGVQVAGKSFVDLGLVGCNSFSISSHKIGGPQGVGALVLSSGSLRPAPLLNGGGQESWRRAGTENKSGIAGFAAAANAALRELDSQEVIGFQTQLERGLKRISPDAVVFGEQSSRLANTTCFACPKIVAETALIAFDLAGVAVSSGSACSSGKVGVSHVLEAMGVGGDLARGAIRVSYGWNSSCEDIDRFLEVWARIYERMGPAKPLRSRAI
ncbi:cysteine desulfurase family protein [Flexibacterium corallicola]|uniref:cysteine desulfurase family protein n=1 Tax=Flexibacterium corallicola TaxID=3037259 RepID=UPI00286F0614|nr:cysteine desulfurase family protein [Pseudovibrio sp. M1P-2-3]